MRTTDRRSDRRNAKRQCRVAFLFTALVALLQACGGGGADDTVVRQGDAVVQRKAVAAASSIESALPTADKAVVAAPRRFSGLALNLAGFDYWSKDFPTIDQFKRAGGWFTSCDEVNLTTPYVPGDCMFSKADRDAYKSAWDTLEQGKLDLDENGWVRSLPAVSDPNAKFHMASSILFAGDGGAHPAGTYTVLYEGKGEIEYLGATGIVRGDHRDQMTISNA